MSAVPLRESTGPFTDRPGSHIIQDFRTHLAETAKPDTWRYHEPSQPPRDQDFEELLRFEIPDKKRRDVGKASCPICSPMAPKYFEGALAWFPNEGVLRAIGHECASSHFGVARHNAAIAKRRHREAVIRAQDFLLDALPRVVAFREEAGALEAAASDVDRLRQAFWSRSSKPACTRLARAGREGLLTVEEHKEIAAVDAYGKGRQQHQAQVVAAYRVAAMGFLTRKFLVLGQARNTALALSQVQAAADEESALVFVCDVLHKDEYLFEAERIARAAVDELKKLQMTIDEAKTFIAPANLTALAEWSGDARSGAPVQFDFHPRFPRIVRIRSAGKRWCEIKFPDTLAMQLEE